MKILGFEYKLLYQVVFVDLTCVCACTATITLSSVPTTYFHGDIRKTKTIQHDTPCIDLEVKSSG